MTFYLGEGADPEKVVTALFDRLIDQEDQDLVYVRPKGDITEVHWA
jgi:hypothetical protein